VAASAPEHARWNHDWQKVEFGVEIRVVRGLKSSLLFREKKTRQHREITREAPYKGFVIGDFPPNRVAPHFCQPALDFSACVRLLPVEALAAPHGPGYVTTVRHINHRAPNARLIGHLSRGPEGVGRGLFLHGQFLRNRHKTAKMLELSQ